MKTLVMLGVVFAMSAQQSDAQDPGQTPRLGTKIEIVKVEEPVQPAVRQVGKPKKGAASARFAIGEGDEAHEFAVALGKNTAPAISVEVTEVAGSFDYVYEVAAGEPAEAGTPAQAISWVRPKNPIIVAEKSQPEGVRSGFGLQWSFAHGLKPGEKVRLLRATDPRGPGLIKMVAGVDLPAPHIPEKRLSRNVFEPGGPVTDEHQFNLVLTLGPKLESAADAREEIAEAAEEPEFAGMRSDLEALDGADEDRIIETLSRLRTSAPSKLGRQWAGGLLAFLQRPRK